MQGSLPFHTERPVDKVQMTIFSPMFRISAMALALTGAASAVPAQAPTLAMLDRLEKGSWQLRERGKDAVLQTVCLGDARRLI